MTVKFLNTKRAWAVVFAGIRRQHWIAFAILAAALLIGASIGFDDAELSDYQLKFVRLLATLLGGFAVVFGALRYIWERHQELAWEKTRFMVELFKEFEEDPNLRRAQLLVDYSWSSRDESRLKSALVPMHRLVTPQAAEDRKALDRYLDFFDHLYTYLFITRTLTPEEASSFSGYAIDILDSPTLSEWAFEWGYEDVLRLGIHFRENARISGRETATEELMDKVELLRQDPDKMGSVTERELDAEHQG